MAGQRYTRAELRRMIDERRRELTRRDVELARQQREIERQRGAIAAELQELDKADLLLE